MIRMPVRPMPCFEFLCRVHCSVPQDGPKLAGRLEDICYAAVFECDGGLSGKCRGPPSSLGHTILIRTSASPNFSRDLGFHAWLTFLQNDKPNSAHEQHQAVPGTQGFTSQGPGSVAGNGPGDAALATENLGIAPATFRGFQDSRHPSFCLGPAHPFIRGSLVRCKTTASGHFELAEGECPTHGKTWVSLRQESSRKEEVPRNTETFHRDPAG